MTGFLDVAAAAKFLSRSPRWVRQHYRSIPHFRPPGGQILFDIADLKAWMSRFRVEPAHIDISGLVNRVVQPRRRGIKGRFRGGEPA
jgi:hypothetical protein